jgi:hypothetical protein
VILLRPCCAATCSSVARRRRCSDALGEEAPAGRGEAKEVCGVGEGACDDDGSLIGRGCEEVGGVARGAAGGGGHLQQGLARVLCQRAAQQSLPLLSSLS